MTDIVEVQLFELKLILGKNRAQICKDNFLVFYFDQIKFFNFALEVLI